MFLKLNHLHEDTIAEIETILHKVERPTRGLFHEGRGTDYRQKMIEMHISEIGFCSGHSASGVFVDEFARTTVPGLYAAGDMASVPHNYMLGAFTYGSVAGEDADGITPTTPTSPTSMPADDRAGEGARLAPTDARGRHPAEPDRVQGAPPGQRLSAAAEGDAQVSSSGQRVSPKCARTWSTA